MYRKYSELKAMARGRLLGKYGVAVGSLLLMQLIMLILAQITAAAVDRTTVFGIVLYVAINFIVTLIQAVFSVGENSIFLELACEQRAKISDLFNGFSRHPDKAIMIQFMIMIRLIFVMIPMIIVAGYMLAYNVVTTELNIAVCVTAVLALIGGIYIRVITSQCLYLLLDYPDYSPKDIMEMSKGMMKGYVWRYIGLVLSFIPMFLLVIVSLGIGYMFVYPYYKMTLTEFYLELVDSNNKVGELGKRVYIKPNTVDMEDTGVRYEPSESVYLAKKETFLEVAKPNDNNMETADFEAVYSEKVNDDKSTDEKTGED